MWGGGIGRRIKGGIEEAVEGGIGGREGCRKIY
jgi:hypothetical protein